MWTKNNHVSVNLETLRTMLEMQAVDALSIGYANEKVFHGWEACKAGLEDCTGNLKKVGTTVTNLSSAEGSIKGIKLTLVSVLKLAA